MVQIEGHRGQGLRFDGDDAVVLERLVQGSFTVSFWVRSDRRGPGKSSMTYEPEEMKVILDEFCAAAGVQTTASPSYTHIASRSSGAAPKAMPPARPRPSRASNSLGWLMTWSACQSSMASPSPR